MFCQCFLFTNECTSDCLKNNIKIYIKTARTCFGAVTSSSGSTLFVLAKVTVVKIANYVTLVCGDVAAYFGRSLLVCVYVALFGSVTLASTDVALPEDGVTAPKHVRVLLT
jgi:hypothetical protein